MQLDTSESAISALKNDQLHAEVSNEFQLQRSQKRALQSHKMQEFSSCNAFHRIRLDSAATSWTIGTITGLQYMQSIILNHVRQINWVSVDAGFGGFMHVRMTLLPRPKDARLLHELSSWTRSGHC